MTPSPYPLLFHPILKEKVWGGRRLERWGKSLPPGINVGESWELADLDTTSPSGGGGDAAHSLIANGPLEGRSIRDAMSLWGGSLLGAVSPGPHGSFPLLVKYLDARQNLSVQVHPSPSHALAHPQSHLKTESWYVLEAEPGAVIYKGIRAGVTRELFVRHVGEGTVANDLVSVPAIAGDCHTLPSGTCHALGAGVLVAEIQTPSDTTFRVFDWGRTGRELHLAQALECIDFGDAPGATHLRPGETEGRLASTPHFAIDERRIGPGTEVSIGSGELCMLRLLIAASGAVTWGRGATSTLSLSRGATCLVPAEIVRHVRFRTDAPTTILLVTPAGV